MEKTETEILSMIEKASRAPNALDAVHLSQAALNAANALCTLENIKHMRKA